MKRPKILFLIRSNPEQDTRVAEAVRMAAGLGTGQNSVKILLDGDGIRLLDPDLEDMADEDVIERFLPVLGDWEIPFYLRKGSGSGAGNPKVRSGIHVEEVDDEAFSELMAGAHCFFVF
jgi:sulfur relay (sulfurtransferase) DsrF/TusC family protein